MSVRIKYVFKIKFKIKNSKMIHNILSEIKEVIVIRIQTNKIKKILLYIIKNILKINFLLQI